MPNKTYIVIACVLFSFSLFFNCSKNDSTTVPSENFITVSTFGGTKNESGNSVIPTLDGGYTVLGYAQSSDGDITGKINESFDYWLLKFDSNNHLLWNKTYGGSGDDRGKDIIETSDGGYAVIGYTSSLDGNITQNSGAQDYWLAKLDATGNITWQKSFGFSGNDTGISLIQTNDNGYLLIGILDVTSSGGEGNYNRASRHAGGDYWAIKVDANGDKVWSRYYGGTFTDTPYDVIETQDHGYIIVGSSDSSDIDISSSKGAYDFWIIKISRVGELIWEKSFGGSEIDEAHSIVDSGDGNFLVAGDTRSNDIDVSANHGASDIWLIKISPNGELIWGKTFGGTGFDAARSITKTQDNGFIIAGSSRSLDGDLTVNKGQNDAWVIKINSNAELVWQKSIGGLETDFAYGIAQLSNNTIIAVGDTNSTDGDILENKGFTDTLIIKIK